MRKWLSLRHWKSTFVRIYKLIISREVSITDKLLFLVPVILYWVLPDALPFLPIDDIAVTMLLAEWFARRMEKKYNRIR
ncbi:MULTISPECIES: hypothetical protein [unclassified Paenibacillus]|uniref:hypothetical protein n=1 Tax=unclassified Paenibacillus TaxID=185978 RepID=UPI00104B896B|nr:MULTISPECIES: hypothetical protein [unclassified Paenibacillus]NIK67377.1 uncharacterized membrane protein YkvA (DUF1232 family) [Paenibacillus sp. BK720]TCN01420.1 hypothetical protein EV294_101875 [Paenibacillus sp. BK033]